MCVCLAVLALGVVGLTRIELVTSSLSGMRSVAVLLSLETLTSLDL